MSSDPIYDLNFVMQHHSYVFDDSIKDMDTLILRGHLLIETRLNAIIEKFVFHKKYIEESRLSFSNKQKIAQSISLSEHNNSMWKLLTALNSLRNEVSHNILPEIDEKKLDKLKQVFESELHNTPYQNEWKKDPLQGIRLMIAHCIGFLNEMYREIERFKQIILTLDKQYNDGGRLKED